MKYLLICRSSRWPLYWTRDEKKTQPRHCNRDNNDDDKKKKNNSQPRWGRWSRALRPAGPLPRRARCFLPNVCPDIEPLKYSKHGPGDMYTNDQFRERSYFIFFLSFFFVYWWANWSVDGCNLWDSAAVSSAIVTRHGQRSQLSHGHLQQATAGGLRLGGQQRLCAGNYFARELQNIIKD